MEDIYLLKCPHCNIDIIVKKTELNCCIFRCGIYKNNSMPVNPHLTKIECDKLVIDNKIYGCSKPFKVIKPPEIKTPELQNTELQNTELKVEKCGYI